MDLRDQLAVEILKAYIVAHDGHWFENDIQMYVIRSYRAADEMLAARDSDLRGTLRDVAQRMAQRAQKVHG